MRSIRVLLAAGAMTLAMALSSNFEAMAAEPECYAKPVKASGGRGLMEATAKSRARSAWIKKVRGHRRLGPAYAAWLRAKNPQYACRKLGRRYHCDAQAIPCRVIGDVALPLRR
ncbi:MAG: hypothetical protein R3D67_13030 [Hyphomicrobiaceae bacterium]